MKVSRIWPVASEFPPPRSFREGSRPRLPEVALSLDGGESFRMHLGDLYLASVDPTTGVESVYQFPLRIEPGAVLGSSVTLHPSGFLSHEIYFGTLQANLPAGEDPGPQVDRIKKRTAGYQLEGNLAPRRWRLRPFLSAGGSLTSYKFKTIKLSKKDGVFKYGLRRVGTVVSAFNSAGVAALDGGSVFQPASTYGGGLKPRITRLLGFQAEYRENYAKDPDFFSKQSLNLSSQGISYPSLLAGSDCTFRFALSVHLLCLGTAIAFALPASLFVGMMDIPREVPLQRAGLVLALILARVGLFLVAWILLGRLKPPQDPPSIIWALKLATSATPVFGIAVLQPLLGDTSAGTVLAAERQPRSPRHLDIPLLREKERLCPDQSSITGARISGSTSSNASSMTLLIRAVSLRKSFSLQN